MSRYTEKLILNAFGEMLQEMPFDKITVSALTRRSDVSHNTFYYHYRDIHDLLRIWIRNETAPFLDPERRYPTWEASISAMLRAWQQDRERIYHVFDSISRAQMEHCVFEQLDSFFYEQVKRFPDADTIPEPQLKRISDFVCYIFLGFLTRFLWSGMEMEIEENVRELGRLLMGFVNHSISDIRAQEP